jgi:hypothetical protein
MHIEENQMRTKLTKTSIISTLFLIMIFDKANAAYIDPNTGGMLFQILAVLFGFLSTIILVFSSKIKMFFYRIMRALRKTKSESDNLQNEPSDR